MLLPWLKAFVLTLAIEIPIASMVLRPKAVGRARLVLLLAFANLATHPVVWFVFPMLPVDRYLAAASSALPFAVIRYAAFVLSELFAFAAEALFFALVFQGTSVRRALAASFAANATSLGIGLLLYRYLSSWLMS
ncbi:MAG: hypothetical protein HY898_18445 [Deltaproteobacteria bacterium]|nr:hypothetical protein [Deltaproteobacteria bacterium]